jgi:diacylglycerol kinase family enzyme
VLTADSDDYALRHGRIVVQETAGKEDRTYLLGGASLCPNQEVTDAQIDMLVRAAGNPKLVIKPFYQLGNGNSRCLVGFALGAKKQVAAITHL